MGANRVPGKVDYRLYPVCKQTCSNLSAWIKNGGSPPRRIFGIVFHCPKFDILPVEVWSFFFFSGSLMRGATFATTLAIAGKICCHTVQPLIRRGPFHKSLRRGWQARPGTFASNPGQFGLWPLPEKTALKAKIFGRIEEKIIA